MSLETQNPDAPAIAWSWLKTISRDLYSLDETPLLGSSPDFPWLKLTEEFAKAFAIENFKITPGELVWKENDAIMSGIATPALCTQISATGIDGTASFWMCQEDVQHLMAKVLQISEVVSELQADDVVTNFHRFLGIETISLLNQIGYDPRLSFKITSYAEEHPTAALCQDIHVQLGSERMLCRLVLSSEFRASWKSFFLKPLNQTTASSKLDQIETTLHVEAARTTLKFDDLLKIRVGDLVLLDHVFYDQSSDKSHVLLTLNERPLFRASLDAGTLKIIEIPLQNEVYTPMTEKVTPPSSASNSESEEQVPPPEQEDENPFPDEEEEDDDEGLELIEAAANTSIEDIVKAPVKSKPASVVQTPSPTSDELTADDIPTQLVVEVAAINLSVQKLLELSPGNMLDLHLNPENGVNLVVNGRVIGKGELLKIGETIGVRILQIGV